MLISLHKNASKFATEKERNDLLNAFVQNYSHTRLRLLGYKSPVETLHNLTGHNTKAGEAIFEFQWVTSYGFFNLNRP